MTVAVIMEAAGVHGTRRPSTDYHQRRISEEASAMAIATPDSLELKGICGVCALQGSCEDMSRSTEPVMHCEQFRPDPAQVCEMVNRAVSGRASAALAAGSDNHMGLCENCEHRGYCAFPSREGGVWYCEEYE
jgi:hypothetical protein